MTVRPLEANILSLPESDYPDCVELQRRVWGFERRDLVTARMLGTCVRHGGMVLGTRGPGPDLAGFVFSFPALWEGRLHQHSHMLAVREDLRDRGLGAALKRAQYDQTRQRGMDLITWTFDPLEAKNAHLNLNKLGVLVRHYYVNLYGEDTSSRLHQGLGTDRFLAEWRVGTGDVPQGRSQADPGAALSFPQVLETRPGRQGWREPAALHLHLAVPRMALEIPADIQELKQDAPVLAGRWRVQTRAAFRHYLSHGYRIEQLLRCRPSREHPGRVFYLLEAAAAGKGSAGER